jgi:hypothetical protein
MPRAAPAKSHLVKLGKKLISRGGMKGVEGYELGNANVHTTVFLTLKSAA